MWSKITHNELIWLGIDFDDTIANNSGYPDYIPTEPLPGTKEALDELSKKHKIVVFTARPWSDYVGIETWCKKHKLPVRRIICGKPLFKYIVDDKNIEFSGDWKAVVKKICS